GKLLRRARQQHQVFIAALAVGEAVVVDMRFQGLHEARQQVAVYFRFSVSRVEVLEVVDVEEGDRERGVANLAPGPKIGEVEQEQGRGLKDVELFVVLARG